MPKQLGKKATTPKLEMKRGGAIVDLGSNRVVRRVVGSTIINPDINKVVGEKQSDGTWSGPHPWDDTATLSDDTPIGLTAAQMAANDADMFDPNLA